MGEIWFLKLFVALLCGSEKYIVGCSALVGRFAASTEECVSKNGR